MNLRVEPWLARANFDRSRLGMDSPLTPFDEFEMLDRVGDIDVVRRDSGTFHRVMKQLSSWAYEWMAEPVFAVAGLLPNEHHSRADATFAENRLRCVFIEIAAAAVRRRGA